MIKKGLLFGCLIVFSCTTPEEPTPLPTKAHIAGYWKLTLIEFNGERIGFNEYPGKMTSAPIENFFYHFNETDNAFEHVLEVDVAVTLSNGTWELTTDSLSLAYAGGGSLNYKVREFSFSEIEVTDRLFPAYILTYKRMERDDYPETLMSATVNNQSFEARSNQAYLEQAGYLQLTGNNEENDWIAIFLNQPKSLVARATYPIGNGITLTYAPKGDHAHEYNLPVSGQITIQKISETYIDLVFSAILKDEAGQEVSITGGKFKAIIKNPG